MSDRKCFLYSLILTWVFAVFSAQAASQDKTDFDASSLYKSLCASCHGLTGDGDGPVAGSLMAKIEPLSTLAKRNGGNFPRYRVAQIIDGREEVKAHGTRLMPVWGNYYRQMHQGAGSDASAETITRFLVQYLESIQKD